jgi:hypothetical protein
VEDFQNGRHLSAGEAIWHILGYNITSIRPSVTALPVHVPDSIRHHQYHQKGGKHSTLSALNRYFLRPIGQFVHDRVPQNFDDLKYSEYYALFYHVTRKSPVVPDNSYVTCDPGEGNAWVYATHRTKASVHLTRLQPIRPGAGEAFYIRHLLSFHPARTWEGLRTIEGTVHDTYQQAAITAGLFASENEAELAMEEAVNVSLCTPYQLRLLFVYLLTNDCCDAPLALWDLYLEPLSDDFYYWHDQNRHMALNSTLNAIGELLAEYSKTLDDFGLPQPLVYTHEVALELRRFSDHSTLRRAAEDSVATFNDGQRRIFDEVLNAVNSGHPLAAFVAGSAGSGKTFLVHALCNMVRGQGGIVLPTATSAAAATLYSGGRTTHSAFKVCLLSSKRVCQHLIRVSGLSCRTKRTHFIIY